MMIRWIWRLLVVAVILVYGPFVWFWIFTPSVAHQLSRPADAALIFGALVRSEAVSPLHAERLDTAVALYETGKVPVLVASNATRASEIMRDYLIQAGVPAGAIELDGQAQATPDTCVAEAARDEPRQVVLVSQAYHLPRIALQCRRLGVEGQYVKAVRQDRDPEVGALTLLRVRGIRYTREAVLIWAELTGQYRRLEEAAEPGGWLSPYLHLAGSH